MKNLILLLLITASSFFFSACKTETEVTGEIFVVTEGAGNYKLGLVQVQAIPEKDILEHISLSSEMASKGIQSAQDRYDSLKRKYAAERENLEKIDYGSYYAYGNAEDSLDRTKGLLDQMSVAMNDLNYELGGKSYFNKLPKAAAVAQTNADGKFSLIVPKAGKYALVAQSQRKVADKTEEYYWMI